MDLWSVRNQAFAEINSTLKQEGKILEEAFSLLDRSIGHLLSIATNDESNKRFAIACAYTLIKLRHLALGSYSLLLDGLVLEPGALMRSFIEGWQILIYFRLKPERIEAFFAENMPQAGEIARSIDDELHNEIKDTLWKLRQHYNQYSSHFSLKEQALMPAQIVFDKEKLKTDMRSLFGVIGHILMEAARCLTLIGSVDRALFNNIKSLTERGFKVFDFEE